MIDIKKAIEFAKQNPNSDFAVELRRRIESGQLDNELKAAKMTNNNPAPAVKQEQAAPQEKSFGRKVFDFFTGNEQKLAQTYGDAMAVNTKDVKEAQKSQADLDDLNMKLAQQIVDMKKAGKDTSRLEQVYKNNTGDRFDLAKIAPSINKSIKQIAGESLGVAADIAGAGSYSKSMKSFSLGKELPGMMGGSVAKEGLWQGAKEGFKTGAKTGLMFGGVEGAAKSMQDNESWQNIAAKGGIGAVAGATLGGTLGALFGGGSGYFSKRKTTQELLKNNVLDARTATLTSTGKIDRVAKEAVKQGLDEADVAVIKSGSKEDLDKFNKMYDLAEKGLIDKTATIDKRPVDFVGDTIVDAAKHLNGKLKGEYKKLDVAANNLKGNRLNGSGALLDSVEESVFNFGGTIKKGEINFSGSDYEDIGGVTKIINNVYKRLKTAEDAYDYHKIKRYIDNNVSYGKSSGDLSGNAEYLLKTWRRNIDKALDTQFSDYNKVNSTISEIIGNFDNLASTYGKKFKITDEFANMRASQVASRILGKSPNRGDILSTTNMLFKTAKKYGFKSNEDFAKQVIFADILEDIFGSKAVGAPGSFKGQIERAISSSAYSLAKDGKLSLGEAAFKVGADVIDKARGKSEDGLKEALKALIKIKDSK